MKANHTLIVLTAYLICCALIGCTRSSPPEVAEFRPPPKKVVEEKIPPQVVSDTAPSVAEPPKPEPKAEPEKPKETAPPAKPETKPEPKPEKKEESAAPTIIGSWKVVEMSHAGQSRPLPDGMEMIYIFTEDGTLNMEMSGGPLPEAQTKQGSYTLSGQQVTITVDGHSQTATYSFDGPDRLILEMETGEAKVTLSRV
jgi:outer membrane biosynthesis protein TonB